MLTQKIQQMVRTAGRLGLPNAVRFKCADPWYKGLAKLGLPTREKYQLCAKSSAWPLQVRANTSDKQVFGMIHVDGEYEPLDDLDNVRLIVDCGANVGYASAYFLTRFPQAQAIAVEPDDRNFEMLRDNMQPYGNRVSLRHAGIWSHTAGLVICRNEYRDGAEWATQVRECRDGETADVQATNIGTLLAESGCDAIDLLKIDIERSELVVFARNYESWLGRVRNLVIELHDEECRRVFFEALSPYVYDLCESGELTICKNIRPAGGEGKP